MKNMRRYNLEVDWKESTVGFFDDTFPMSNVYPAVVEYNGVSYASSEHAYQSAKFKDSPQVLQEIYKELDPIKVASLADIYRDQVPSDWNSRKYEIMKDIVRNKIIQNPGIYRLLMKSFDWLLYENTPEDAYWGYIKNENGSFDGENNLGKILMQLREELLES